MYFPVVGRSGASTDSFWCTIDENVGILSEHWRMAQKFCELLNTFLKPILVFFTFPITIFTLGLFLLVINAGMVLLCDKLVDGFDVASFVTAIIFSVLLSISQWVLYKFIKD